MKRVHLFAIALLAISHMVKIGLVALFCAYHSTQTASFVLLLKSDDHYCC